MIRFLQARGHSYTLKKVKGAKGAPAISLMNYDRLIRAVWLRPATHIFTDLDRLGAWELELASHLYLQLKSRGLRVLNCPATVKTRYPLLRALHAAGLNDFNAYRPDEIGDKIRFPVFVRKSHGHRAPISDLLETREELQHTIDSAVAAGTPLENLIVIEYAGEPVRPGLYRKLAAFRIGNEIVPHISGHDTTWLVKIGKLGIAGEELYREELHLLQTNPFAEHLRKAFDVAHIEYGRADFGIYRGRIQIFEINTNPHLAPLDEHPSPTRIESMWYGWEKYLAALRRIDSGGGWPVRVANGELQGFRAWKNLWVRSRRVP